MLEEALLLVNRARHTWEEHLLRSHNVVGVGIGLKETGGVRTTDPAVVIYVSTKLPPARLSARDVLPPTLSVKLETGAPGEVATDVVETGHIRALSGPRDRSRPALGGCSVGHHACGCAGTLGGLVTDSKGRTLVLSNNHVMAMLNDAKRGDRILQPGPFDGGVVSDDTLGRVDRYVTIRWGGKDANFVDACTAKPSDGNIVAAGFLGIGDVRPTLASAVLDMKVRKSGRTTGVTTGGEITDIDATFTVGYGSKGSALFKNQTVIRSSKRFSDHGDSGSFILTEEEPLRAVGLLFAGNSPGTVTLANHMRTVLEELEVRLPEGGDDAA